MRYWWVNHKQTVRQEISGGYLWSPKREANGARSQFYDNMRLASPGDLVLSYAGGIIGHAGIVVDFPFAAPKPNAFDGVGAYWNSDGWLLPVDWTSLQTPVRPKALLAELQPWLPKKYSPINPMSGNGNQKAYLAEINPDVYKRVADTAGIAKLPARESTLRSDFVAQLESECEREIQQNAHLSGTEKQQLITARIGQGLFRERVSAVERSCRLTEIANPRLLIASHIKPWRMCSSAGERLDGANGLLLTPHVDRLFDRGLISFTDGGDILLSTKVDLADIEKLGLRDLCERNCGSFTPEQAIYLNFHRQNVFLP